MKVLSSQLDTHFQGETSTLTTCAKIILSKYQPRIVNITQANPGIITTRWPHGWTTGDVVILRNIRGMTELNRSEVVVTKISALEFSIGINTTSYTTYTHKGVAQKVIGYTSFRRDLTFENLIYKATMAYMPQSIRQQADFSVDTIGLEGILQNAAKNEIANVLIDGISDEDLMAGRYDNARAEFFQVNYEDLTMGRVNLISGRFGEATLHRGKYEIQFNTLAVFLQETLTRHYSGTCRADLGDDYDMSEPEHKLHPGHGCKVKLDPPYWQASTSYSVRPAAEAGLGSVIKSNVYNGRQFKCSVAGISGTNEPAWNTAIDDTTVDGSVTWITIEALTKTGVVHEVIDKRRFIDNDRDEQPILGAGGLTTLFEIIAVNTGAKRFTIAGEHAANFPANARFQVVGSPQNDGTYTIESSSNSGGDTLIIVTTTPINSTAGGYIIGRLPELVGFFTHGLLTFLSGKNIGISREVKNFSLATVDGTIFVGPGTFEFFEAFPFEINVGDAYEATAGCDKSLLICKNKFDNMNNRRAEDNIPGQDAALQYPDAI